MPDQKNFPDISARGRIRPTLCGGSAPEHKAQVYQPPVTGAQVYKTQAARTQARKLVLNLKPKIQFTNLDPGPLTLFKIILVTCALSLLTMAAPSALADTIWPGGDITENTTWYANLDPYIIQGDVRVVSGVTLTIEPGVVVKFDGYYRLEIDGILNAQGMPGNRITFTSNAGNPNMNDWSRILLEGSESSASEISYCDIQFAGHGIHFRNSSPAVNEVIASNNVHGFFISQGASPTITNSEFTLNNAGIRIGREGGADPAAIVHDSSIHGNFVYSVYFDNAMSDPNAILNFENNWWGTTDPASISTSIIDHHDDASLAYFDFVPFLDSEGGNPIPYYAVGGSITQNALWSFALSPYLMQGTITVQSGATLTIEPGVEIKVQPDLGIELQVASGSLMAQGTAQTPVSFTSDASAPESGDWNGLRFQGGTNPQTTLDYVTINYAGNPGLRIDYPATIIVRNSSITNSSGIAVQAFSINQTRNFGTGNTYTGNVPDAIEWTNTSLTEVKISMTLNNQGVPYIANGSIDVGEFPNPITFTIHPGVEIRFNPGLNLKFEVGGSYYALLLAQGTEQNPIIFTSNATNKQRGDWQGVRLSGGTQPDSILDHVKIEYGKDPGLLINANSNSLSFTVTNTAVKESLGNGMSIRGIGTVNNCVIQHNSNAGLKILGGAPGIQNTSFLNNEAVAVSAPSMLETRNFGTGNTYTGNVPDAIEWTNTSLTEVKISMTLNNQGVPYIANGSIDVGEFPNPITFTIHPGVEIRFNPQQNLRLGVGTTYASHFIAQGTAQDPIIFTSNAAQPQKGDWQGVRFSGTTTNLTLDHVVIEYGQDPNFEMYQPVNFSITNSIFRYALGRGIVLRGNGTFNNNVVEENDGQGLHIAHGAPSILNSFIQNNVLTGLWVDALATTPAFDGNQFLNNGSRAANIYSINQLRYMTANNTFFGITNPICECIELMNTAESLIDYDTTLFNFGYPYVLNGDLSIYKDNSRAILTVTPGVTLQFKPGLNLQLKVGGFNANAKGALLAYGTSTDPITFSSSNPIPAPGDWQGIRLETGAQPETAFRHTIIEYAGNPGLRVNQSFARVENTIFQFQTGDHIQLTGSNSYLFIQQSQFSANGFNAVNNTGPNMVQAPLNWWGHETGPSGSGGGSGIPIQGNVHYDPWLGTPRTAPFQWQSAHISPREFKPADNTATFQLSPTDGINWTIEILSSDFSQVLKTITGSGAMIQQDWEGDDQNNETLPDDDYKFRVSGTRISNGEPIASAIGQLTLNQNIPVAKITLPVADDFLAGFTAYDITGTASGADFQDFTLEYYNTNTGIGFNTLASGQNPIEEGLIFNWDLADLAASFITLRLTVTDTAQRVAVDEVPVRIFNLFNISNSESFISPNNDQIQDASLIEAQSTHLADWLLEIKDDAHATVRSIDRDGFVFFSFLWDGKNDAGNLVPDGEYTYEFTVTESSTNVSPPTQPGATAVTVDTVYPETVITDPVNNQSIFGLSYGVIGTANDLNFKDYVLEHSRDGFPNQFDVFATGNANVVNDLLGTWPDLHTFSNGNYAIRLNTADKAGNRVIILVPVVLDNINITDISRAPVFFDHKRGETGNINYTISLDADVTIRLIEDRDGGVLIRTLLDQEPRLAGVHQEVWDGRDDQGSLLPYEAYYFEIEAETTEGRHDLFIDPRQDTWNYSPGMVEFIGENFDPYKSEKVIFTYHPTYHIRHFINILDGNLQGIRTIQMDEPKPKDETSAVRWDGRKYDGSFHTGFYKLNIEIPIDPDLHEQTIILKDTFEHPASVYQANAYLILPLNGEVTHFQYTLDNQADITVTIEDPNGSHFRTLVDNEPQSQGNYEVLWDGKNDLGEYAAIEGHYRFTINAVDQVTGSEKAVIGNVSVYQS